MKRLEYKPEYLWVVEDNVRCDGLWRDCLKDNSPKLDLVKMVKKSSSPLAALDESDDDMEEQTTTTGDGDDSTGVGIGRGHEHNALKELQAAFQRVMAERRATA